MKNKKNKTWGNVNPDDHATNESQQDNMKENARRTGAMGNVKSTNMDPVEDAHVKDASGKRKDWQQLNEKEEKQARNRKDGYPKNTGTRR